MVTEDMEVKGVYWRMREEFQCAYEAANKILKLTDYEFGKMVRTAHIIDAVEKLTGVKIEFREVDFSEIRDKDNKKGRFSKYGAAMYVADGTAKIILNEAETAEMQRFSLVHELGHLMCQSDEENKNNFMFSTHIDMDITSISEKTLEENPFLLKEQNANIFALLVLMPNHIFYPTVDTFDSLEDMAKIFGVTKNAVVSRLMLGPVEEA